MTARDEFDRLLNTWLRETAGTSAPDYLDETLVAVGRLHQGVPRTGPWRRLPVLATRRRLARPHAGPSLALLLLLIGLALLAVAIVGSQRRLPPPYGLAATGLLAFDADGDIYVAEHDGSGVRALVAAPELQYGATFSPDGTRVAYWTSAQGQPPELWVVDDYGRHARSLTGGLLFSVDSEVPAGTWSPDGSRIAFSSRTLDLYVVSTDGSGRPRRIGSGSGPAWSPDGDWVAIQKREGWYGSGGIEVVRPDGTGARRVGGAAEAIGLPDWSPDGRSLVYGAILGDPESDDLVEGIAIATRAGDGWDERVVATGADAGLVRLSNDGSRVTFVRWLDPFVGDRDQFQGAVYVVGIDGTGLRRVADLPVSGASRPCWTPDDGAVAVLTGEWQPVRDSYQGWREELVDARYLVLPVDDGLVGAEISAPGINGLGGCSWQRLAP